MGELDGSCAPSLYAFKIEEEPSVRRLDTTCRSLLRRPDLPCRHVHALLLDCPPYPVSVGGSAVNVCPECTEVLSTP